MMQFGSVRETKVALNNVVHAYDGLGFEPAGSGGKWRRLI
jgi:hypothetical protein